ncbi:MAG: T9SS type A sorting domain-containing protein, partial [Flavipsychrobacter sp.]
FKLTIPICACLISLVVNSAHARLRLTAATNCHSNGTSFIPSDSSVFIYSGYRSGGMIFSTSGWTLATNCDTACLRYYDQATGKYYLWRRTINTYDTHDNLLLQLNQFYDSTRAIWYDGNLSTYVYDANNNQLTSMSQYWDTSGGSGGMWKNMSKHNKAYDTHNNNIADTAYSWNGSAWQINQLYVFTYDSYNYLVSSVIYNGGTISGTFINNFKTVYSLNAGHKPDSTISYLWSTGSSAWQYFERDNYTYDASYNMLTDTNILWSNMTSVWKPKYLYIYTYSGADVISKEAKTYISTTGWQNNGKENMNYDANHNLLTDIVQYWKAYKSAYDSITKIENTFNTDNKITTYTNVNWDSASASWKQTTSNQQSRYYYETDTGLAVSNINADHSVMKVYPSPASSYINVDLSDMDNKAAILAIYDATGRLYKQWQSQPGNSYHVTVPVNALPAGDYFLEMREGQTQKATQFTVTH